MTTQIPHFIDGKRTAGRSTRTADVFNPSTGQVQAQVPMAGKADIDAAVASAVEAQKGWAAWNPQRRARVMMRFVELVNDAGDELAELLSIEHVSRRRGSPRRRCRHWRRRKRCPRLRSPARSPQNRWALQTATPTQACRWCLRPLLRRVYRHRSRSRC